MKQEKLDEALQHLASIQLPRVPNNLAASVLREVRFRQTCPRMPRAEMLASWLWKGQVALTSITVAIAMGFGVGILAPAEPSRSAASHNLFLDVFSQSSRTLPSTYIASNR